MSTQKFPLCFSQFIPDYGCIKAVGVLYRLSKADHHIVDLFSLVRDQWIAILFRVLFSKLFLFRRNGSTRRIIGDRLHQVNTFSGFFTGYFQSRTGHLSRCGNFTLIAQFIELLDHQAVLVRFRTSRVDNIRILGD